MESDVNKMPKRERENNFYIGDENDEGLSCCVCVCVALNTETERDTKKFESETEAKEWQRERALYQTKTGKRKFNARLSL